MSGRAGTRYLPILDRSRSRLRLPIDILPEALRQAGDGGLASPVAAVRMETGGLIVDGKLDPVAASLLQVITRASLVVEVEVRFDRDESLATVWATPNRAVVTSTLDPELVDIEPVRLNRLPETLSDLILLRSPATVPDRPIWVLTAQLAAADAVRHDPVAFRQRLTAGGVPSSDIDRLAAFEAASTRKWRISSTWATPDGRQTAELRGLDAGQHGQWLIELTGHPETDGEMVFTPQDDGGVLRALRSVLPRRWVGTALNPDAAARIPVVR